VGKGRERCINVREICVEGGEEGVGWKAVFSSESWCV
jgi:hypothetical protein